MKLSPDSIDKGFAPALPTFLPHNQKEYIDRVKLPNYGTPAPTFDGSRAAIWLGEKIDHNGESALLAVVAANSGDFIDARSRWFVGIVSLELIARESEIIESVAPREAVILDKAQYGGLHEVTHAVHLLMGMYRA